MDYTTELRLIRANLGEKPSDESTHLIDDDTLTVWLDASNGNADRVTYKALLTIAASEVLTSKVIRTQDLQTDGAKVASELRALAQEYKRSADEADGEIHFAGYVPDVEARRREAEERRVYGDIEWF